MPWLVRDGPAESRAPRGSRNAPSARSGPRQWPFALGRHEGWERSSHGSAQRFGLIDPRLGQQVDEWHASTFRLKSLAPALPSPVHPTLRLDRRGIPRAMAAIESRPSPGPARCPPPHWPARQVVRSVGWSQPAVSRLWRALGPRPHRAESFHLTSVSTNRVHPFPRQPRYGRQRGATRL